MNTKRGTNNDSSPWRQESVVVNPPKPVSAGSWWTTARREEWSETLKTHAHRLASSQFGGPQKPYNAFED